LFPTMTLLAINAFDQLYSTIPPPTPMSIELLLIRLPETVGSPAAQRLMPPPSLAEKLLLMTLFSTCTVPAPLTASPPPPLLHPISLRTMLLPRMVAAEKYASMLTRRTCRRLPMEVRPG
jgi:hypothetical protein